MTLSSTDAFGGTILDIAPGSTLGRYELLVPIATGGMARVWAARQRGHAGFSKLVAIKMILPELAEDPTFQKMFTDEARIASLVRHPNVCETYDLAETRGVLYLAMEWVDGASLLKILRESADYSEPGVARTPIDPRHAARIIADAAAGLHAAHELCGDDGKPMNVIHRDATPHNILLAADGRVKVSDFGVAKALGQSHATVAGEVKGKVSYMAPEQLTGDPMDRRVDVFALGVCLYEATTGRKPFVGENDPQVMAKIMLGRFDKPSIVKPGYPPELERIIMRAMDMSPPNRFATAEELQLALEKYIARTGPPVMPSAIATLLKSRCGAEIDSRRETIRLASIEPPKRDEEFLPDSEVHFTTSSHDVNRALTAKPEVTLPAAELGRELARASNPPPLPPAAMRASNPSFTNEAAASLRVSTPAVSARPPAPTAPPRVSNAPPPMPLAPLAPPLMREERVAKSDASIKMNGAVDLRTMRSRDSKFGIMAAGIALVAVVGLVGGGFAIVQARKSSTSAVTADSRASKIAPVVSVQHEESPLKQVRFHVAPDSAVLVVDGVVLPRGTNVVQMRPDGESESVLIRAEKFEDYVVILDHDTPSDVSVKLTPIVEGAATSAPVVHRVPRSSPSASASGATSAKAPSNQGEALPNPYGE